MRNLTKSTPSPWGAIQHLEQLGMGIASVSTAGHGGIFVPTHLLHNIPQARRDWAAKSSGSPNWYEEDCCWAAVAVAFPQLFDDEALRHAAATLANFGPDAKR